MKRYIPRARRQQQQQQQKRRYTRNPLGAKPSRKGIHAPPEPVPAIAYKTRLAALLVADPYWPGMFRVRLKDGSMSSVRNLAHARDLAERVLLNQWCPWQNIGMVT